MADDDYKEAVDLSLCHYKTVNDCIARRYRKLYRHKWTNKNLKKEKQRQQGHISILNHVYVLQIHKKAELKKGPIKKQRIRGLYAFNTSRCNKTF